MSGSESRPALSPASDHSTFIEFAPSLPPVIPLVPAAPTATRGNLLELQPGAQIDDFQVIAILGRGGFGVVYLAWQNSLGRQVALKVAPSVGQEGRTLARLDHPHIVRVYAESVREGWRLLCMQYVPSAPLDELIRELQVRAPSWTGQQLLDTIDQRHPFAAAFDPQQLQDRQWLAGLDHVDACCWMIARLAHALAHAHRQQVLHRDLKPGNVLISQYGRPMLVDFNLAEARTGDDATSSVFGGTLPYMAPEHLAAYNPEDPTPLDAVTTQSDVYSLGIVFFELLTGRLPFPLVAGGSLSSATLRDMAAVRQQLAPIDAAQELVAEPAVRTILRRCLAPLPAERFTSAEDLARTLEDALALRGALRRAQSQLPFLELLRRHPFLLLAIGGVGPHLLGSLVNIPYNLLRVVDAEQRTVFFRLIDWYNVAIYPVCVALCMWLVRPLYRYWREQTRQASPSATERPLVAEEQIALSNRLRQRALRFPDWAMRVAWLGWLPGSIWFPLGLHWWAGPLSATEVLHLELSLFLSALIALTYSVQCVLVVTTGLFYAPLWVDPTGFRGQAEREMAPLKKWTKLLPLLAGAIPLVGAVLLIGSSPRNFTDAEYFTFRALTTGLIALGMAGFQLSVIASHYAAKAIEIFTSPISANDS